MHTVKSCQSTAQPKMRAAPGQLPVKTTEEPISLLGIQGKFQVKPMRIGESAWRCRVVRLYCYGCIQ